ncbi:MAG TPA: 1-deoxy-D-xylulose-5-phosphate reductoisomerase [Candidatus Eisenbacteria bacterium]|nr:1-deoxy-D-xylulose-5-phosphate reductoisomerase [Candidatus Eisenbacteria bacterium]
MTQDVARTDWPVFPRRIAVLGATGTIGEKALAVVEQYPGRFQVVSLAAGRATPRLAEQAARFGVPKVAFATGEAGVAFPSGATVKRGGEAVAALAADPEVDLVLNGIVGRAGLEASLAALRAGKMLALANKESLVIAGELLMNTAREHGGRVIPIDSEHSGLFQCLAGRGLDEVRRLYITASGGPFRTRPLADLHTVRPEEALRHPVWSMGPRITVDSATLLNKGLEIIETHWLFGMASDAIHVWIHPQSVVHAIVEWQDGSLIAQLSTPDMILPVQYAMSLPERWERAAPVCRLPDWKELVFEEPDPERFPSLAVARLALARGGTAPAALNAADEVAVDAFLNGRIGFLDIVPLVSRVVENLRVRPADSLESIAAADTEARDEARSLIRH